MTDPSAQQAAGLFRFSLEGRRAPALFVLGWLATIVGAGTTAIGYLALGSGPAGALAAAGLAVLSLGLFALGGSQTVERTAARLAYPGPSPFLVMVTAFAVTILAALLVGVPLELSGLKVDRQTGDLVTVLVQALVFLGVVRLMVVAPGALRWREMGFGVGGRRILQALGSGAMFAAPVVVITALVAAAAVQVFGAAPASPLPPSGTTRGLILNLISGAVVAPLAEETLFRGVAVTAWARMAGPRAAIVRAAVLFAIAHVLLIGGDTFAQALALAVVGALARIPVALALGWIYLRTGTIWASIGLHATFNAILIVIGEASAGLFGI